MSNQNIENNAAKIAIVGAAVTTDSPFKTAFKATLGFYLAQTLVGIAGLTIFALIIFILVMLGVK